MESVLSPSTVWPAAVSAIAGTIAAITAFATLLRAATLERERSRDRAAETRADYFKALLTKPLSKEADRLSRLIQIRTKQLVKALAATAVPKEREKLVQSTIDEVREGFIAFSYELRVATRAWRDDDLTGKLYLETGEWEDHTQLTIAALLGPAPNADPDDVRRSCTAYRTALRRVLLDSDPLLVRDEQRQNAGNAIVQFFKGS